MTHRLRWALPVAVGLGGLVLGALVAAISGIPAVEALHLLLYSTAGAAIAGGIAALVLTALRRTTFGVQAAVGALAPVVAMAIGVTWASDRMFLMSHDLRVLGVVLCSAGGVGVIISILLGRRVAGAVRSVGDMARRLGEAGPGTDLGGGGRTAGVPGELAALGAALQQTSARLAEAREQALALEHSRRELVAWVSHDLRTPLAGIRAMVEALEDGVVDDTETVARYHTTIRQEADRLAGLVNDLFELSKIQAGSLSLTYESVPLDELVADAISGTSVAASAKDIEIRGQIRTPTSSTVELSTPEMARVVRNLLDNAIRHTPAGGTIIVDASLDDGDAWAVVSVLDGCGGIPEADLDRVFEMAYRGDFARTPGESGGGLGLAVARGLVEAHHGDISVHNEGPGCRFVVRLPLHRS
jgi:signal transduction histidine kinase